MQDVMAVASELGSALALALELALASELALALVLALVPAQVRRKESRLHNWTTPAVCLRNPNARTEDSRQQASLRAPPHGPQERKPMSFLVHLEKARGKACPCQRGWDSSSTGSPVAW